MWGRADSTDAEADIDSSDFMSEENLVKLQNEFEESVNNGTVDLNEEVHLDMNDDVEPVIIDNNDKKHVRKNDVQINKDLNRKGFSSKSSATGETSNTTGVNELQTRIINALKANQEEEELFERKFHRTLSKQREIKREQAKIVEAERLAAEEKAER